MTAGSEALIARLRVASNAVYLACPGPVADDLSEMLRLAADRLAALEAANARLRSALPDADVLTRAATACRNVAPLSGARWFDWVPELLDRMAAAIGGPS